MTAARDTRAGFVQAIAKDNASGATKVSKPFKVGFIGAGGIARHHMRFLKEMPGVEVAAAADVSEAALKLSKEQYSIPNIYTDYKDILSK